MSWVGAGATVLGAGIGAYGASQSGGDAQGSELPWYIKDPTKAYFSKLSPYKPGGEPRNHGGFWGQYDPQAYQGSTLASAGDRYMGAMKDYANSGSDPKSSTGQAEQFYQNQVNGDYLGLSGPMQQAVMDPAIDEVSSRFAKMGRSGLNPSNAQAQLSAGLSSLMPFHNQALNRQMDAASALPGFDDMRMQREGLIGDYRMNQQQGRINDSVRIHDFEQNKWLNSMQAYQGLLNPNTGYAPAQPAQQNPNYANAAIGGALAGSTLWDQYNSAPSQVSYDDRYSAGVGTTGGNGIDAMNLQFANS